MMRKVVQLAVVFMLALASRFTHAQMDAFQNWCQDGGVKVFTSGLPSSTMVQASYPQCKVDVFLTGTLNRASIFKDKLGTPLSNPFTAFKDGYWLFFAADGQGYDVVMSSGTPNPFPSPRTLTDLIIGAGGGGGGTVFSFSAGNLAPLFTTTVTNPTSNPVLNFNLSNAANLSFLGNVSGSTGPPSYINFVAGSNITLTPSGGNTLTIAASGGGGGGCGPLSGDATSTVCGNNNLVGSAGTNRQTFGYNNSNNLDATQSVTIGTANGNEVSSTGINIPNLVAIGNANAQNMQGVSSDIIAIGHQNFQSPPNSLSEAVIIGEGNANGMTNNQVNSDLIAIGDENYINMGGTENIVIGNNSLTSLHGDHLDDENIAIGAFAMGTIDAGGGSNSIKTSIAIGVGAMNSASVVANQSWGDNIAIGSNAMQEVTQGHNIAIGLDADSWGTGRFNIAIGTNAMLGPVHQSTPALPHEDVVAVGHLAAAANSSGNFNVAIGTQSGAVGYDPTGGGTNGNSNLTGSNNTWVGAFSGPNTTTQLSNTVALGYQAFNTQSNQTVIGNSSITQLIAFGTGDGCLTSTSGVITGSGSACGGGSSLCGPLSGDTNSTNCGNSNFTGLPLTEGLTASQAYGFFNINSTATGARNLVAVGYDNLFEIGNNVRDVISIGNTSALRLTASSHDFVVLGQAASSNAGGNNHVAIGQAADSNTVGTEMIAIGDGAGVLRTGSDIISIGDGAGSVGGGSTTPVDAFATISIGSGAGDQNSLTGITVAGSELIAIGDGAGGGQNNAADIVAIGDGAGSGRVTFACPTTGHDLVAIGNHVAWSVTGAFNVAIGHNDLGAGLGDVSGCSGFTSGSQNIALGDTALAALTTGSGNIAIGQSSGSNGWVSRTSVGNSNQTGINNTWVGTQTGPTSTTQLSNTIALGFQAVPTASNQTIVGNSSITQLIIFGSGNGCLSSSGGVITGSGVACGSGGGGSAFSAITGSTNTTATMVVGTGATLATAGSGTIAATSIGGITVSGTPAIGNVLTATSTSAANWQAPSGGGAVSAVSNSDGTLTITPTTGAVVASIALGHANTWSAIQTLSGLTLSGITGSTQCLQVNTSGVVSGTGSVCGSGGGSTAWSALTNPSGNLALTMASNTTTFTFGATTGSSDLFKWTDTTSNTGTGIIGHFTTAASSTEIPWQADANGIGWRVATDGSLRGVGSLASHGMILPAGTALTPVATAGGISTDSSGNLLSSDNGGAFARVCNATNGICGGSSTIVASAELVTFSATPTFSVAFNTSRIVLTNNITSFTLGAGVNGQDKTLCFKQGAGPFTVTPPSNVHGFFTVGVTNTDWNCQSFNYDLTDSIWLATSAGVINQ